MKIIPQENRCFKAILLEESSQELAKLIGRLANRGIKVNVLDQKGLEIYFCLDESK